MGEVGEFIRGRRFTKADVVADGIPSIHYGEIYTRYGTATSHVVSHVRRDLAHHLRYAEPGDVVIAGVGETVEDVGKAVAWLGDEPVAIHDDTFRYRSPMNPTFVSYVMQTAAFNTQKTRHVRRAKMKRIGAEALATIRVPVPALCAQEEVARLLDGLERASRDLAVELQTEVEARRRQHDFYREELFTFDGVEVRWAPIGQIGKILRGKRFTKADYVDEGGVGCIHYGEIYTDYGTSATSTVSRVRRDLGPQLRFATKGDVVLTDVGETVDDVGKAVAWMGDEDVAIHDHCYVFRSSLNPVFVSFYMQTARYRADKDKYIARTKVKTLLPDGLPRLLLPVPSPIEQQRIVAVLDDYDVLLDDFTSELRAEITARRQQFERYRDWLLAFDGTPA
jgi:type I restriction enzyme S subunit